MKKYSILLADDHPLVRRGLKTVIEVLGIASTIYEADDGLQVLEHARQHTIDLFILDFKMPRMNGFDAANILLQLNPKCKIIVVSMYDDHSLISNLLGIGVRGFLVKNTSIDEIETAIATVLSGDIYLHKEFEHCLKQAKQSPIKLTPREKELIASLASGRTSKDIAESWGLTLKTIETYRSRLLEKMSVKNTTELLDYVHRSGLA